MCKMGSSRTAMIRSSCNLDVSVSGFYGCDVISLVTRLIQIRSFMMMFFALITMLFDRESPLSITFISLTFMDFTE